MVMEKRSKKNKTKEKKRSRESFSVPVVKNDAIEDDLEIQLTLTTELIKKKVKISDDLESSIDEDANQIYFEKSEQTEMITLQEQKQAINVQEVRKFLLILNIHVNEFAFVYPTNIMKSLPYP